jgi:hypothetical protein
VLVRYTLTGTPHQVEVPDSHDLAALCAETETRLRELHPELATRPHLAEQVADGLLNGLAVDVLEADLGDLT